MSEPLQPRQEGLITRAMATMVFWWLTLMGTATLALAATIPMWIEYKQVVHVRDQVQRQVEAMQKHVDRNNYFIKAYTEDPEAIDMLAITDLRYRRPDEAPLPLPSFVMNQVKPAGWDDDQASASSVSKDAHPANAKTPVKPVGMEKYVEYAKALSIHYLGPAKSIGLVDVFCDPTCRKALTGGALAVLAAALFLCRSNPQD